MRTLGTLRILVTGSKRWTDVDAVRGALNNFWRRVAADVPAERVTIITGGCEEGAEAIAEKWAHMVGAKLERHQANWAEAGEPSAGPMHNEATVDAGADICLAFWSGSTKGSGTFDCFRRCIFAGIPVFIIPMRRRSTAPRVREAE